MNARRSAAVAVDLAAMAAVALAIWFGWNPLLRYLPRGLPADVDVVFGWLGAPAGARSWLGWLGEVAWLVGLLAIVALFCAAEKLVGLIARRLDDRG